MAADDILFERRGRIGLVTLNRPAALNALTHDMNLRLDAALIDWAGDPTVDAVVVIGAGERAFCAGGDVRALYDARNSPSRALHRAFYRDEYRLNRHIFRYGKPYIAVIDGIVMGGGVGVSIHGRFRVVTEKAVFAMPETGIGLFPDVGGSYFLPRCPGRIGLYLGLTGARLGAADMVYAGLATHFVPRTQIAALLSALATEPDDATLDAMAADPGTAPLATLRDPIDRCFADGSVEAILAALAREGTPWAESTAKAMRARAPLALKVTCRQLERGATLDIEDCLRMEMHMVQHFMSGHDFFEGVRALLIDKDMSPRWNPARIEDVSEAQVEACFVPVGADLTFPD